MHLFPSTIHHTIIVNGSSLTHLVNYLCRMVEMQWSPDMCTHHDTGPGHGPGPGGGHQVSPVRTVAEKYSNIAGEMSTLWNMPILKCYTDIILEKIHTQIVLLHSPTYLDVSNWVQFCIFHWSWGTTWHCPHTGCWSVCSCRSTQQRILSQLSLNKNNNWN